MKVILTNKQFDIIAEALKARFTISEATVTFTGGLNEGMGGFIPPHRKMAMNLAGNHDFRYRLINRVSRNDTTDPNNPFNNVPCAGVSYYFEASFKVDGKPVRGAIRISDHPATPITFAKRGYDYGLSIVFDNSTARVGKHNSIDATVFEYSTDSMGREAAIKARELTTQFINAMGTVKIENGTVVSPSGINFKKLNRQSGKQEARDISLFTSWASKTARFMSPADGIEVTAVRDNKGNYTLPDEELKKFNYGDTIHFYKIEKGTYVELGRSLTVEV